ncbi:leucine-rich repeat-containing protein 40-like [Diadema setosum]|uniref:leucine-rich repeat-containing protein 40-like n=1 Tax=Diadema setosum TaxID=31175 RepID=UPI003B3BAE9E
MSRRGGRPPFNTRAGFQNKNTEEGKSGVPNAILKQARASGHLNLSNRSLTSVPQSVWNINIDVPPEAQNVSLDNKEDRWWEQTDLVKLILASNKLEQLSDDIKQLPALTVLDVHDNKLVSLPSSIGELSNLQRLNISHNCLTELPRELFGLPDLLFLHMQHNKISALHDDLGNLSHLENLDVSNNQLSELPDSFGSLHKLKSLNASDNQLVSLTSYIGNLKGIRMLELNNNKLTSLPIEIGYMSSLEQLHIKFNKITALPPFTKCKNLKELHAGNNCISELGEELLESITSLNVLDVRDNKLSCIPEGIVQITTLSRLNIANNNVSSLPFKLGNLASLRALVLDGNPLRSIRRDIINRGTMELMKYLRSRIEEAPEDTPDSGGPSASDPSSVLGRSVAVTGKTLDHSNQKSAAIPVSVWEPARESGVTAVNFSKNILTQVPENLILLHKTVIDVNLSSNKIQSLPVEMQMMVNITRLDLGNNGLSDIPAEFETMTGMRELVISYNRFTKLPSVVFSWTKLEIILANDNQVNSIDVASLKLLSHLSTLDLQNNSIGEVPPELGNVTSLRSLQLAGNCFRNPRPAILNKGTVALLAYLRDRIPT